MNKKFSKKEAEKEIENFFKNIQSKTPKEIKKLKKLAMSYNIPLKEKRKLLCKKCFVFLDSKNSRTRIKKGKKIIICENCGSVNRWKIN